MRKHIVLSIIVLLLSANSITAATPDSTIVEHNSMWTPASSVALANPSIHGMAYQHALTQFNYQGSFSQQNTAFVLEKGKGANSHTLFASTFLRLSPISSAWGELLTPLLDKKKYVGTLFPTTNYWLRTSFPIALEATLASKNIGLREAIRLSLASGMQVERWRLERNKNTETMTLA